VDNKITRLNKRWGRDLEEIMKKGVRKAVQGWFGDAHLLAQERFLLGGFEAIEGGLERPVMRGSSKVMVGVMLITTKMRGC